MSYRETFYKGKKIVAVQSGAGWVAQIDGLPGRTMAYSTAEAAIQNVKNLIDIR
jgi:hypothetical protein